MDAKASLTFTTSLFAGAKSTADAMPEILRRKISEEVGFEPTRLSPNGFQDRSAASPASFVTIVSACSYAD